MNYPVESLCVACDLYKTGYGKSKRLSCFVHQIDVDGLSKVATLRLCVGPFNLSLVMPASVYRKFSHMVCEALIKVGGENGKEV